MQNAFVGYDVLLLILQFTLILDVVWFIGLDETIREDSAISWFLC